MKTLQTTLCAAAVALFVGVAALPAVRADDAKSPAPTSQPVNTKCPVSGDDIDPKVTTVYNGKTYAFCCADCVKAFNKDPEKYASKAK
jgi:YHS domain-containing protein